MPRIKPVDPDTATGETKRMLDAVKQRMGRVSNSLCITANSPTVFNAYLSYRDALSRGLLDVQVRERIAIVCAETNACQYSLSHHTAIAKSVGLSNSELKLAFQAAASNPKIDAAIKFAHLILTKKGAVSDGDVRFLKNFGWSDSEIIEIIANVSLYQFTNYLNIVAGTEIDFPKVELTPMPASRS